MAETTILIIEDNPTNRKLIEAVLRRAGYHLLTAENGELGVEIALREQPQLVLMDIQMPTMNGLEATRILRANPLTAATPIVALTASSIADEQERAMEAGCSGYITKPIDPRTFPELIQTFLRGKS